MRVNFLYTINLGMVYKEVKGKISFFLFCFVAGFKITPYFCIAFERNNHRSMLSTESRKNKEILFQYTRMTQ